MLKALVPIILAEIKNCRLSMYRDENDKMRLVFGYQKGELPRFQKEFVLDYEKIIAPIKAKFKTTDQDIEQAGEATDRIVNTGNKFFNWLNKDSSNLQELSAGQ